jgi:hypothetical protein
MARLKTAGVPVDSTLRPAAEHLLTRDLEIDVAREAFGDADARKRTVSEDPPLQRAIELLSKSHSQAELLSLATTAKKP